MRKHMLCPGLRWKQLSSIEWYFPIVVFTRMHTDTSLISKDSKVGFLSQRVSLNQLSSHYDFLLRSLT